MFPSNSWVGAPPSSTTELWWERKIIWDLNVKKIGNKKIWKNCCEKLSLTILQKLLSMWYLTKKHKHSKCPKNCKIHWGGKTKNIFLSKKSCSKYLKEALIVLNTSCKNRFALLLKSLRYQFHWTTLNFRWSAMLETIFLVYVCLLNWEDIYVLSAGDIFTLSCQNSKMFLIFVTNFSISGLLTLFCVRVARVGETTIFLGYWIIKGAQTGR